MPDVQAALSVLQQFIAASLKHDKAAMEQCLTRQTIESGQYHGDTPDNVTFTLGDPIVEGSTVVIPMRATANGADAPPVMDMQCIMVQEGDGPKKAWKFDLPATMERMMGGGLQTAMNEMASAMSKAVKGIGEAFSAGMQEAFGGPPSDAPTPDWSAVPLLPAVDELLPLLEMTPLPKLSAALSAAVGSPVLADAAITDLLKQVASDQRKVLIDWFEDQLFAAWGELFTQAGQQVHLKNRLRALRIEPVPRPEHRFLALDGSDLVYRIYLNDQSGYYSDAELSDILPGVLAGLPKKIEPSLAGHRLLPIEDEPYTLQTYRERIAPRFMRRISDLLGRQIALQINWDDVFSPDQTALELTRWGLNRLWGAIAKACLEPDMKARLSTDLETLSIQLGYDERGRVAIYSGTEFELSLSTFQGEKGCFYEYELLRALHGDNFGASRSDQEMDTADDQEDDEESSHARAGDDGEEDRDEIAPSAEALNDDLFRSAVESFKSAQDAWRQQVEMATGRPTELVLDYDALRGQYDLLQPFIHQALSGALGALSTLAFSPDYMGKMPAIDRLEISIPGANAPTSATLEGTTLRILIKLGPDGPPPVPEAAAALRQAFASATPAPNPASRAKVAKATKPSAKSPKSPAKSVKAKAAISTRRPPPAAKKSPPRKKSK
jgi:hypothetical protein